MAGGSPHFQLWLERDPVCGTVCSVQAIKWRTNPRHLVILT